jgi:hypothetical protein
VLVTSYTNSALDNILLLTICVLPAVQVLARPAPSCTLCVRW